MIPFSAELKKVKNKLVDEATDKTLTLTYSTENRRKRRETQALNSNGDIEAEEIAVDCEPGYETIDDQCRKLFAHQHKLSYTVKKFRLRFVLQITKSSDRNDAKISNSTGLFSFIKISPIRP
jgi:hypothetical protein